MRTRPVATPPCAQALWSLLLLAFLDLCPSHCVRVSPSMANRMVDAARSVLNKYLPDVYIYTDVVKGSDAGR